MGGRWCWGGWLLRFRLRAHPIHVEQGNVQGNTDFSLFWFINLIFLFSIMWPTFFQKLELHILSASTVGRDITATFDALSKGCLALAHVALSVSFFVTISLEPNRSKNLISKIIYASLTCSKTYTHITSCTLRIKIPGPQTFATHCSEYAQSFFLSSIHSW